MRTLARNPTTVYSKKEGQRFNADTTLVCVTCATCGVLYAIPDSFNRSALRYHGDKKNGWSICCPFGHTWHYVGETDVERAKRLEKEALDSLARERALHDQTRATLVGTKAAKTRIKNDRDKIRARAEATLCPVPGCHRSFKQVQRHIAAKHPDWTEHAHVGDA